MASSVSCLTARPASTHPFDTEGTSIMTATSDASTSEREDVIGGVDTHADTIHVALVSVLGRDLVDKEFATTPEGYADALEFLSSHGEIYRVGIEGTSSYGCLLYTSDAADDLLCVDLGG